MTGRWGNLPNIVAQRQDLANAVIANAGANVAGQQAFDAAVEAANTIRQSVQQQPYTGLPMTVAQAAANGGAGVLYNTATQGNGGGTLYLQTPLAQPSAASQVALDLATSGGAGWQTAGVHGVPQQQDVLAGLMRTYSRSR